jgi:hypothetical protein
MDARDDYVIRGAGDATYVDPGRSAQRKVGMFVYIALYGKIDPADSSGYADDAAFQDAAYNAFVQAFADEGVGDYFVESFPYKLLIWFNTTPSGLLTATPAFPSHAHVFTHAFNPTDDAGATLASNLATVLGGSTLAAWEAIPSAAIADTLALDSAYPHKRYATFAQYVNPDLNTDGAHTSYATPYGLLETPYTNNVAFDEGHPSGAALKATFDSANPTTLELRDSYVASSLQKLMSRHANIPIPYIIPFNNFEQPGSTPF